MSNFATMSLKEFLEQSASGAPTPGGGGIAALAGALGASMASMAANFTAGKPKFAEHDEAMRTILAALRPLIASLLAAVDGDAAAFSGISAAYKLPKTTDEEKSARKTAIDAALTASMRVPAGMVKDCLAAAEILPELAEKGNPNLLSDVTVAAIMLRASAEAAQVNVLVNSKSLFTPEAESAETDAARALARITELSEKTKRIVAERTGA